MPCNRVELSGGRVGLTPSTEYIGRLFAQIIMVLIKTSLFVHIIL